MDYMLKYRGVKSASAGGRIAVRLTDANASFPDHWVTNILACGALNWSSSTVFTNGCASAGTVYLQTASEGEGHGTIYIRNGGQTTNPATTAIPSTRYGGEQDDLKNVSLVVGDAALVNLTESLRLNTVSVEDGCSIDLAGKTLTVGSITLDGDKLDVGSYTAEQIAANGYDEIVDSDADTAGSLVVTGGGGLMLIIR